MPSRDHRLAEPLSEVIAPSLEHDGRDEAEDGMGDKRNHDAAHGHSAEGKRLPLSPVSGSAGGYRFCLKAASGGVPEL